MTMAMVDNGCSMVVNDNGNGFGNVNDGGGRLDQVVVLNGCCHLRVDDVDDHNDDDVLHDDEKPKLKPVSPINNYDPPGC